MTHNETICGLQGFTELEDSSAWTVYKLEKDLVKLQDYLVCEMQRIVSNAMYSLQQTMQQKTLDDFNNAINGVQDYLSQRCYAWNCLNYTQVGAVAPPPRKQSARSAARSQCIL